MRYFLLSFLTLFGTIAFGQDIPNGTSFPAVPGVTPVILLDFDGHHVEAGNVWTGFTGGEPFVADGSGMSEEDMYITYQVIAEDFRPWQVAVTTDESVFNAAPEDARMRVIFTQTSAWYGGGAGGAAFMESFGWANTSCWVFTDALGGDGKYAGDAGSHQVGHTLNLPHHNLYNENCEVVAEYNTGYGDEETVWAPIMGAGYYSNISTWDDGEKVQPFDCDSRKRGDVETISLRFERRIDDYSSPTNLQITTEPRIVSIMVSGIIEEQDDEDAFMLVVPEETTMQLSIRTPLHNENFGFVNNLDARLIIHDQEDNVMHEFSQDKKVGIDAEFTFLPNRRYALVVTNDENEWMSDYGSLGSFVLTGQGTTRSVELTVNLGPDTSMCLDLIKAGYQLNADPQRKNPSGTQYTFGTETKLDDPLFTVYQPGVYTVRVHNENTIPMELADTVVLTSIQDAVPGFSMSGFDSTHCVAYINFTDNSSSACGSIDSIIFDFGDGHKVALAAGQDVIHSYQRQGVYIVRQTVYADGLELKHAQPLVVKLATPPTNLLGDDLKVCEGTLATITLTTKYNYGEFVWSDNPSAGMTRRVGPGEYIVDGELIDRNGEPSYCYFSDTIAVTSSRSVLPNFEVVSNSVGVVSFRNTTTTCDGTQPSRYRWIFGDGKESNEVNPTIRFTEFGDVIVTLIASTASESQSIEKVVNVGWVQIPFNVKPRDMPGRDLPGGKRQVLTFQIKGRKLIADGSILNIQVEGTERRAYQLFSVDGKMYGNGQLMPGLNIIDAGRVPKGLFYMRTFGGGEQEVIKFIKP